MEEKVGITLDETKALIQNAADKANDRYMALVSQQGYGSIDDVYNFFYEELGLIHYDPWSGGYVWNNNDEWIYITELEEAKG